MLCICILQTLAHPRALTQSLACCFKPLLNQLGGVSLQQKQAPNIGGNVRKTLTYLKKQQLLNLPAVVLRSENILNMNHRVLFRTLCCFAGEPRGLQPTQGVVKAPVVCGKSLPGPGHHRAPSGGMRQRRRWLGEGDEDGNWIIEGCMGEKTGMFHKGKKNNSFGRVMLVGPIA